MPCMKTCCFYASTRLGSIVIGALTIVFAEDLVVIGGSDGILQMAKRTHQNIDEFDQQEIFMWVLQQMESNSDQVFLYVMIFFAVHTLCCIVMIVGAFKLLRYLHVPFIILEFARLTLLTLAHVTTMMVVKKQLNLGDLIALTIAGGFGLLLLFYLWACVVSLFQIIGIIQTEKYQALFGKDPIAPVKKDIPNTLEKEIVTRVQPSALKDKEYFTYNTNFTNEYFNASKHNI
uniref:Uncharacterized protein n=1 Tax=Culex quinquefasciatus TaxID=7176 RepID=A0A1S4K369_CULQU